jgi:hypothetical protein
MNKTVGLQLVAYSLLLAGLSSLAYELAPDLARATLVTGLLGGGLCLVWGVGAVLGKQGKAPSVLTLLPINFVMAAQTMLALGAGGRQVTPDRTVAAMTIVLVVLSALMLGRVGYAGLPLDGRAPSPTEDGEANPQITGEPPAQANVVKDT